jgi:hypothetical protein
MSRLSMAPSTDNGSDYMGKGGVPITTILSDDLNTDGREGSEQTQR